MESFNIGRTLSRSARLVVQSLPGAGLFLLLFQLVGLAVQYVGRGQMVEVIAATQVPGDPAAGLALFTSGWYWGMLIVSSALGAVSYAGAMGGILKVAQDQPTSLADCLSIGLAKALPVLGLSLLWGLAITVGLALLVVPGVILMLMWAVSMPALVNERIGVFASFGRSRALTKGSRGSIFVLLLLFVIGLYVVLFAVLGTMIGVGASGLAMTATFTPTVMLFSLVTGLVFSLAIGALLVSIYIETLAVKGEASSDTLIAVFQ